MRYRGGMRPILLLLLLGACAAPLAAPLPYPPAARERIVRIALAEWADWGGVVVEAGAPDGPTGAESAPANFPRVLAYWRAVPKDEGAIERNRALYARAIAGTGGDGLWREPYWSAAFVSWLFSAAGVDRAEFAGDAAHALYLDHLDRVAALFPAEAPLVPREAWERAPEPGDILCFDRSSRPLTRWAERRGEAGRFRPMHCDLVVATGPGVVEAVGGNVGDAVSLTRLPADGFGRALATPEGRAVLVVVESRIGRLPPFGAAVVSGRAAGGGGPGG